jgi:hypothetical protein
MEPITSVITEQLTRALGEPVIRIWSNLPQDVRIYAGARSASFDVTTSISDLAATR